MVTDGIVLGHKVSVAGIEVDKAKIKVLTGLPTPMSVKDVKSFVGDSGFYGRFINDFSKIAKPLTALLCKEVNFDFTSKCFKAFEEIKTALVTSPFVQNPYWNFPFKVMCGASDLM
ncbi:hypothetical protein N665_0041s0025 [Sinapis alba]|nr:hypothetical protein N665_0041s0025 [Sinapis alba]